MNNPTFLLIHAENINEWQDSICHLILVPVINGLRQEPQEFFFNPEAQFQLVQSGITKEQVDSYPTFRDQWPDVQSIFNKFDLSVSSADGNSIRSLFKTLTRLGIDFSSIEYCNAKAICRRTLDEVSYSIDYLSFKYYSDCITFYEPVSIAERWCDLALKGLATSPAQSFDEFFTITKILPGKISPEAFVPAICKRDYSKRKFNSFDPATVSVDAQPDHPLYGMNVVFTGKMESFKRDDARAAVVRIGGNAPDRLTKDTDYLVVGVQDLRVVGEKGLSSKMKTAAKYKEKGLPIEIIDEDDFIEMLGKENIPDPAE
ncbi:BRCT domain-containing protein [uncultured Duncaniella sp.]|uniref:BRCT domain-containing protein n=1 Tax=uncultured Duncaniella sp. TaxID=2768039 RepID=UPI0025A94061|nr:BRCT domain-containing protein [uncultured Duncaniella sp.]